MHMHHNHTHEMMAMVIDSRTGETALLDNEIRDQLRSTVDAMVMDSVPAIFGNPTVAEAREINMRMLHVALLISAMEMPDGTPVDTDHMRLPGHIAAQLKSMPEAFKPDHFDEMIDSLTETPVEINDYDIEALIKAFFEQEADAKTDEN